MTLTPLHPIYAISGIAFLSILAAGIGRIWPFYRRALQVEGATRLTPLDGLRGILCFSVMYHHASITRAFLGTGQWEQTPSMFYHLLGQTSVALFFCTTSFLFWSRALTSGGEIAPWSFLRGRFFRVVPLFSFVFAASLFIVRRQMDWTHLGTYRNLAHMALFGLYNWGKVGAADVNMANGGVIWTLQCEWAFYIALPALALLIKANGALRIFFIVVAVRIASGMYQPPDFYGFFASGIIAAHVARMPRIAQILRAWYVSVATLLLLGTTPLILHGGYGWLPLMITTLVFIPIACGNTMFGVLTFSGLRLIGIASYSVYLLHGIFLNLARPLLRSQLAHGDIYYWTTVLALAAVVLVFCSITYRYIEWPFIYLEKRLRASSRGANNQQIVAVPALPT